MAGTNKKLTAAVEAYFAELGRVHASGGATGERSAYGPLHGLALEAVTLLDATPDAEILAHALVETGAVPRHAADDAAHIAIAVTNGVDFLVTWNFRHNANAAMRTRIEQVCRRTGYEPSVICTPNELMEANNE